jgi:hypothetical protein
MLILAERRVIFIHLHKCGGTSVELSLAPLLRWNDLLLGSTAAGEALSAVWERHFGLGKHSAATEVERKVGSAFWAECFTFATVRHPCDRAASLFNYIAAKVEPGLDSIGFPRAADAAAQQTWLAAWNPEREATPHWRWPTVRAYLAARAAPHPFGAFLRHPMLTERAPAFRGQHAQLSGPAGLLVREAIPLERLDAEWPALCARAGLPPLPLLRSNETPAPFRRSFAALGGTVEDRRFLEERFAADFDAFGYRRET